MKEAIKALAVYNSPLAKCLAITKYVKRGTGYQEAQQVLETFLKAARRADRGRTPAWRAGRYGAGSERRTETKKYIPDRMPAVRTAGIELQTKGS